ncbi:MAG: phosphodiester glycosidase family protein [Oscillospiraceae bacterium]
MLVSLLPVTAFGLDPQSAELGKGSTIDGTGYHVTSVKNYSIAPDISERVIITNNDAGNSQTVANVMEVSTAGGRAKIVAGYGNRNPKEQGWILKTTTWTRPMSMKRVRPERGGGVNASWFNINTGEPSGYLVMNGVVHHDSSSRAFIAAFDDGSVNVFREGTTLAQAEADQSARQGKTVKILEAVDALVAMVWDGRVVITESGNSGYYPRTCVGIKADGTVVLFQADGTMAPVPWAIPRHEEARMMVALSCVAAIQLDEGGSSTYISQREGEQDVTMRNTPAGGSERVVSGTILVVSTVAASGEFDHAAVTPDDEYYTPGSSVTLTAESHGLLRRCHQGLPEDAVFTVSDASMGTVTATDLSGSSASAVFTSSGKTGDVTVNLVSGGQTVGSAVLHVQNPDRLAFASDEVNLSYKDVSDLGFKATYQTETVHLQDNDIQWSISDPGAGSFSGNRFTVTDNVKYSGSPTVTAVRGDLTASVTVNIGMEPTMIIDGGDADPWDYSTIGTTVDETFSGIASNAVAVGHYANAGRGGVVKGSVVSDTDEAYADIVRFGHKAVKLE